MMMVKCVIPVGGGASLPALSNPAGAGQILAGYDAINAAGAKVDGSMPLGDAVANDLLYGKKAVVNGTEVIGAGAYWQYVKVMSGNIFSNAGLTGSVNIYNPNAEIYGNSLFSTNADMTSLTLNRFYVASGAQSGATFQNCTNLQSINVAIDLSNSTYVTSMFLGCSSLVTVSFVANTIKLSLSFSSSPNLSSASLVSIANGLLEGASAKTLTMHATSKTNMDNLMGDVTGSAGSYVFTANAGGATSLSTFITTNKGWTIA